MKLNKILILLLALILVVSVVACSERSSGGRDYDDDDDDYEASSSKEGETSPSAAGSTPTGQTSPTTAPTTVPTTEPTQAGTEPATIPSATLPSSQLYISLSDSEVVLTKQGQSYPLYNGTYYVGLVKFTSENESVVTFVDGNLVAVSESKDYVWVHVEYNGQKISCKVLCAFTPEEELKISLSNNDVSFDEKGQSAILYNGAAPVDQVTFTSDDPSVATFVDGKVTAVSAGTTTIHAEYKSQKVSCTVRCYITVPEIRLNRIDITFTYKEESWMLYNGEVPKDQVTFSSDDTTVATFIDGVVTAVSSGTTKVHAEYDGQKVTCIIRCNFKENTGTNGTGGVDPDVGGTVLTATINVEESLNIRSGPGTDYSAVGKYFAGEKVTITEYQKNSAGEFWGKTDKGWIHMGYVIVD